MGGILPQGRNRQEYLRAEQERLVKMEKALRGLAEQEDWLRGETLTVEFVYEEGAALEESN